jgi:hypothetical protein
VTTFVLRQLTAYHTICSGGQGHGFGPAPLARHAHLDHDLLLQAATNAEAREQLSFRALKIKLKQRFLNSSKELSGPCCLPSFPAGGDLSLTDEKISKNCGDRSLDQSRRIGLGG